MRGLLAATTSTLTILSLCLANVSAAPPQEAQAHAQAPPASWRRFTNRIISTLWKVPSLQSPCHEKVRARPITAAAESRAGRLAARYGQDIVVRFNVSTAAEARAIAEATEDLYLDVWAFNDDYVDIRLAKSIVRCIAPRACSYSYPPLIHHTRSLRC